jgi:putative spermidine/putrescine transport system ATP-binding protein
VIVGGRDMTGVPPERRNIGVVFQNYSLFPHMTVGANVAFPLRMRRVDRAPREEAVRTALAQVALAGYEQRMPHQLSGGQQQRVAIARAIVYQPDILLMDEPLGALDRRLRGDMQLEIKALHGRLGLTVLYVTHDQDEALSMSDWVAVMNAGQIEQIGSPREIYRHPATLFVADFFGDSLSISASVSRGVAHIEGTDIKVALHNADAETSERKAKLHWRSDQVVLSPADVMQDGEFTIAATVLTTAYSGGSLRLRLQLVTGEIGVVSVPEDAAVRAGDNVLLRLDTKDATVLSPREKG